MLYFLLLVIAVLAFFLLRSTDVPSEEKERVTLAKKNYIQSTLPAYWPHNTEVSKQLFANSLKCAPELVQEYYLRSYLSNLQKEGAQGAWDILTRVEASLGNLSTRSVEQGLQFGIHYSCTQAAVAREWLLVYEQQLASSLIA